MSALPSLETRVWDSTEQRAAHELNEGNSLLLAPGALSSRSFIEETDADEDVRVELHAALPAMPDHLLDQEDPTLSNSGQAGALHPLPRHDKEAFARAASAHTWSATHVKRYLYQLVAIAFWSGVAAMENTRTRLNAAALAAALAAERSR
jgi:hypothetical protein